MTVSDSILASPVLEVQHITKHYASHTALNGVSFSVNEGSIFGLLGPNGAGKSSLIRIINRMSYPDEGCIKIKGQMLHAAHVRDIGYLPEERGLYKKMKVGEHLVYFARLRGLSHADALNQSKKRLSEMDASAWWNKKVEELSKGMQQKVQFAAATLHAPRLLILDEPFSGFDPLNAEMLQQELLDLKNKGTSIILSTHRMDTVETLCDHIALLNKSHLVLSGATQDVKNRFKSHQYRIVLQGVLPVSESYQVVESTTKGEYVHVLIRLTEPETSLNKVIAFLMTKVELKSFTELQPDMQTVFIQAINQSTTHHA